MLLEKTDPLVKDPTDISQVNKGKSKKRSQRQQEKEDLRKVVSTDYGRRFYWRLLEKCNVLGMSYTSGDPYNTAFNEGRRLLGNSLLKEVHDFAPESYVTMWNEFLKSKEKGE